MSAERFVERISRVKRMQRTRIMTIFDRHNVFKSCRETTTILYAGHVCSLLGIRFVIRTFDPYY